jgi:aminoglycoside phosphotransferase (APT) family kinase protein
MIGHAAWTEGIVHKPYKRQLDSAQLSAVMAGAGIDPSLIRSWDELTEGLFNTAYRIELGDGRTFVLKVSPSSDTPLLTYEHGIMATEAMFYQAAATAGTPVPRVVHTDYTHRIVDSDLLLMTHCPGRSWYSQRNHIAETDRARLRGDLGGMVAALHRITGHGFGYPTQSVAPLSASWREAFTAMVDTVLADAAKFGATLPRIAAEITAVLAAHASALEEVTTPVLVHFDLWDGNILVDMATPTPTIGGLIDGERAMWADPLADFISLALFRDIEQDNAFLNGYRTAGGEVTFDAHARQRLSMYRSYLYLIMLTEAVPRGTTGTEHDTTTNLVTTKLLSELAALTASIPS